jgi:hypothetical protein
MLLRLSCSFRRLMLKFVLTCKECLVTKRMEEFFSFRRTGSLVARLFLVWWFPSCSASTSILLCSLNKTTRELWLSSILAYWSTTTWSILNVYQGVYLFHHVNQLLFKTRVSYILCHFWRRSFRWKSKFRSHLRKLFITWYQLNPSKACLWSFHIWTQLWDVSFYIRHAALNFISFDPWFF